LSVYYFFIATKMGGVAFSVWLWSSGYTGNW